MDCAKDCGSLPCLICNEDGGGGGDQLTWSSSSEKTVIGQQLYTVFVLRNILEVPYKLLEGFLENGEHPSEWGILSLCNSCGEEISQCKGLFEEMMRIQRRFKERKEGIIEKIKRRPSGSLKIGNKMNSRLALREKCLNFVENNEYTQLTNPFPEGDVKAAQLQVIIKEEMAEEETPEENEVDLNIYQMDFEEIEDDWILPSDLEEQEETSNEDDLEEEIEESSDSDYKPEEKSPPQKYLKTKPSSSKKPSPPKNKKRGRPPKNGGIKQRPPILKGRPLNKRGLLPPPPPKNPDPLTLVPCPNCEITKFQKFRGDLLFTHLVTCLEEFKEETLPWNCPLCKIEVISSQSTCKPNQETCLRFVEHLNKCQAPDSKETLFEGPYPLSSRLFHCDLCYPKSDPLQNEPCFTFPQFLDHCKFHTKHIHQCTHPQCPPTTRFTIMFNLRCHWRTYHISSPFITPSIPPSILPTLQFWCSHCHLQYPSEAHLSKHLISSHPNIPPSPSPHPCQYCSKVYPSTSLLSLHEYSSHLEEKYFLNCPTCQTYHPDQKSFANHQKSLKHLKALQDNPVPSYSNPQGSKKICEKCGVNCDDASSLQKHLKMYHPSKKIKKSADPPKPRKEVDFKGRSLKCPECKKVFTQVKHLNLHVRTIHEDNWPFHCHSCGKGMSSSSSLKKHLAQQHGEGNYGLLICPVENCGKKYFDADCFENNVNKHDGEKVFKCEYCGNAFIGKNRLKNHLLIHTNPVECEICGQKFRTGGHLRMHMKLHKNKGDC